MTTAVSPPLPVQASTPPHASTALRRQEAVTQFVAQVDTLLGSADAPFTHQLDRIADLLAALSARPDLFPDEHFPAPNGDEDESLYLLADSAASGRALYVWRPAPGLSTPPHDHATWAVIAGIEGEESHTLWRRLDDGAVTGRCALAPSGRAHIGPGERIHFHARDIHSVTISGPRAIKHLHLYGRSLADQPGRLDFDPLKGRYREPTAPVVILQPVTPENPQVRAA